MLKEEKSIYRIVREDELSISREKASELTEFLSPERIEKIENGKVVVQPEDITAMADGYNRPELCNYYCMNECEIGKRYAREIKVLDLAHIAVDTLDSLNKIEKEKERLLEIVSDEEVTPDEYMDFKRIRDNLERIAAAADSLKLWIERADMADELNDSNK